MTTDWLHEYILFALRVNKLIAHRTADTSLLDYYGPVEYRAQVDDEPVLTAQRLLRMAHRLKETLADESFDPMRTTYLGRHVEALRTVCRRLIGERVPLREQALRCLDLQVDYAPESDFEQAYSLYDEGLAGSGSVARRLQKWKTHYVVPREQAHQIPELIQRAVGEARLRTNAMVTLPQDDQVTVDSIRDKPVRAMAHYLGHHRSRILVNLDIPFNLADLLYLVCHEAYPGHLAEIILKEEYLVEQRGYREQQVSFLLTPAFVISEGLALWAHDLVFPEEEAANWLAERIYPRVGIVPDGSQLSKVQRATDLLWGVQGNAALMLDEGRTADEVAGYLERYALLDKAAARRALAALQRPFCEAYIFTYQYGRELLDPWLKGAQRGTMIRRLLTQQVLPSDLAGGSFLTGDDNTDL